MPWLLLLFPKAELFHRALPDLEVMTVSTKLLLRGAIWTIGTYGLSQAIRLATSIFLARLLAPELFGAMLIVYSLRTGMELLSDIGIGQNVVYHQHGTNPDFYNTAWSLQVIRGAILWLVSLGLAVPMAQFYESPILVYVVPLTAFGLVLSGFNSLSRSLLQKSLKIGKLNGFDLIMAFVSSAASVLFAYLSPTIWALVFGGLFGSAVTMIGSHFLLSDVRHKFYLSRGFSGEILHFGKWIFVSSIIYFLSTNFDRLYLAKVVPLQILGVYGIARSISELLSQVVLQLGNYLLFPLIASHSHKPREELRAQLAAIRLKFLLIAAIGLSLFVTTADLPIRILFDERYQAAAWMLPILLIGSWYSILAVINESTLLGLGKPSYSAYSNGLKFAFLAISLPVGVRLYGVLGGVMVIASADLCRYFPIFVGQQRERFSFGIQDLLLTLTAFFLIGFGGWLRWALGYGTSFDSLPLDISEVFGSIW